MGYAGSHLWAIRQVWGKQPLLFPGMVALPAYDQGHILLGYRPALQCWTVIGGSMEYGETITQTMLREVQEETGCEVAAYEAYGVLTNPECNVVYPHGDVTQPVNTLFSVRLDGEPITADDEHSKFAWCEMSDLPSDIHPTARAAVTMYKAFLETKKMQLN